MHTDYVYLQQQSVEYTEYVRRPLCKLSMFIFNSNRLNTLSMLVDLYAN